MSKNKMNRKSNIHDRKRQPKRGQVPVCCTSDMLNAGDYWYCPHCGKRQVMKGGK